MKTNLTLTTATPESCSNEKVEFSASFFEELNTVYLNKRRLASFLKSLSTSDSFFLIKRSIAELQDEISIQLQQLESVCLLANNEGLNCQLEDNISSELENFILGDNKQLFVKNNLSLVVYLQLIERKETVAIKKLISLAEILNYSGCLFILKQPKRLVMDADKFLEKISSLLIQKMVG
jgi:ferritin-like metal-binding protein YciE